jgi:hypothetical protein
VVFLSRNLEYCSYGHTALFLTDDFDELEQKYNQVGCYNMLQYSIQVGCSVSNPAVLRLTDDFDELEQKYNQVGCYNILITHCWSSFSNLGDVFNRLL